MENPVHRQSYCRVENLRLHTKNQNLIYGLRTRLRVLYINIFIYKYKYINMVHNLLDTRKLV